MWFRICLIDSVGDKFEPLVWFAIVDPHAWFFLFCCEEMSGPNVWEENSNEERNEILYSYVTLFSFSPCEIRICPQFPIHVNFGSPRFCAASCPTLTDSQSSILFLSSFNYCHALNFSTTHF